METHFDAWAATYDADVRADPEAFPFAGYDAVLDAITEVVRAAGARQVLELGIGTGNLGARVAAAVPGVELWGVAFADEAGHDAVRGTPGVRWDASEHYVVADRFLAELGPRGIGGAFRPVSFCAGVLTLRRSGDGGFQQTTTTA